MTRFYIQNKKKKHATNLGVASNSENFSLLSIPLSHLVGLAEEWVGAAALVDDVSDQVLLAVVGSQDADAVGWVAQQAHVHVKGHRILGLRQVLCKTRGKC